LLDSR